MKQKQRKRLINLLAAGMVTIMVVAVALAVSAFNYQDTLSRTEAELETIQVTATWAAYEQSLQAAENEQLQQQLNAQETQLDQLEEALDALVTREATFSDLVTDANDQITTLDEENEVLRNQVDLMQDRFVVMLTREAEFVTQIESINQEEGN